MAHVVNPANLIRSSLDKKMILISQNPSFVLNFLPARNVLHTRVTCRREMMIMRKMTFIVIGAVLTAFSLNPVLAQEADDSDMSAPSSDEVMIADVTDAGGMADLMFALLTSSPTIAVALGGSDDGGPTLIAAGPGEGPPPGPGNHWRHPGGGPFGMLQGPLALSDDQWEKLSSIHEDSMDQLGPKKLALHTAMRHFMQAVGDPNQDTKKIKDLQSQMASLRADISSAESNKIVAMSQVLTGDQRAAIHKMMIRHMLMHKWHGGHGVPEHGHEHEGHEGHGPH
jgi:Spy/CpxP family protein refolding chaperone